MPGSKQIRDLVQPIEPVRPAAPGIEIYELFRADPDLLCVPVVDERRPVGMVTRYDFMVKLGDRFGRALWEKRPVGHVMDAAPLILDAATSLDELGHLILTRKPGALTSGFVVTEDGGYLGIGTALSMLRLRVRDSEERSLELEAARRQADAASRAKTEFLANMSHELRSPLNAIIGFSDILQNELFGPLGHRRYREYAADIHHSGQHLLRLIGHILDLSKIEAGKMELSATVADPERIVQDAIRIASGAARSSGVTVTLEVVRPVESLLADETKLRQVLINLLSNAIKFTPSGGHVAVRLADSGADHLAIVVRDTGIGMTDAEVAVALEPFRQVESHLNKRHAGTGLGLPLSKSLVALHGGSFEIESARGEGTVVTIRLPRAQGGATKVA